MTGRSRLNASEPRKASQNRMRPAATLSTRTTEMWRHGDRVRWSGQVGVFTADLHDGVHAHIRIGHRLCRVRLADLRPT
jgi:hypothetical protein